MLNIEWTRASAATLATDETASADWNHLNARGGRLPFLDADAVGHALRQFGSGTELLVSGRAGGECIAMMLMTRSGTGRWSTFQPSQLPLGAWVAAPEHGAADLALSLARSGVLPLCLTVSFTQLDAGFVPRQPDTPTSRADDYIDTAWVDVLGTFDDYWAQRGKNLRQNMRKQRNKLDAEGIRTTVRCFEAAQEMPAAIERYGELESRGWKAGLGTAIRMDNAQGRFYCDLLAGAAARQEARVYEYLFDDRLVASNLCLLRGDMMVILKTCYDESISSFSPAFLLHQALLEALFQEQRIRRIEYYGKVMEWHTRWTGNSRSIYHLTTFRHALVRRLVELRSRRPDDAAEPAQVEAAT